MKFPWHHIRIFCFILNPFTLKSSSQNIVCYFHTFENNLGMKRNSQNIWRRFVACLLINISLSNVFKKKNAFVSEIFSKIVGPLLAALSVNGLINEYMFMAVIWIYCGFPLKNRTLKNYTIVNFVYQVTKSWIKHWFYISDTIMQRYECLRLQGVWSETLSKFGSL